jgi:hypothetical protein
MREIREAAARGAFMLLDVHSFARGGPRVVDDGGGSWDDYPLVVGVDTWSATSVLAGRSLVAYLRRRGLPCATWTVSQETNHLIAYARTQALARGHSAPPPTLLLEFREGPLDARGSAPADVRTAQTYGAALGAWALLIKARESAPPAPPPA